MKFSVRMARWWIEHVHPRRKVTAIYVRAFDDWVKVWDASDVTTTKGAAMPVSKEEALALYNALRDGVRIEGVSKPYSYSGRGMYGDRCIAVNIDGRTGELVQLGVQLAAWDADLPMQKITNGMRTDGMGLGIVAYWPGFAWDDTTMEDDDGDADEC